MTEKALTAVVEEAYVHGLSTRSVDYLSGWGRVAPERTASDEQRLQDIVNERETSPGNCI
jgi:hypothetical protein